MLSSVGRELPKRMRLREEEVAAEAGEQSRRQRVSEL